MSQPTEVSYPVGPLPVDAKESIAAIMREVGLANLSIRVLRRRLETKYKLEFTSHKDKIQEYVDELMGTKEFKKEMALIHKGTEEAAKSKKAPKATKATTSKGASEKKERTSSKTEKAVKAPRVAKEKKPDNYPKAALTGYFLFLNDKRAEVRAANPSAGVAELGKLLGSMWKEVSDADKQKYNDLAAADKKRFEKEMEEYEAAGGEKFKRGGKKDKKGSKKSKKEKKDGPKRATSAFMFFINGKRKEINEANPGIKITAVPKIAADMWKNLTPEESAPWHALAAKDKERYAKECAEGGSTRAPAKKRSKTEAASSSSSSSSSDSDSSSDSSSDSDSSDSSSSDSDSD